jgi:MtN3 and saliva related transmembrane protein
MSLLSMLATAFGIIGATANAPQAWKIFKRKSAKDISILTYGMIMASAVIWVLYGFEIGNFPVIISNLIGIVFVSAVIVGWFLYGRA